MNKRGFTLIELLIVVAIMAIIAVVVFVSLDPLTRFQDSRDSVRWQQVSEVLNAVKLYQIDHGGSNLLAVSNLAANKTYMIGTDASGCETYNTNCDTDVAGTNDCVNLNGLVTTGYLSTVPVSPNGAGTWIAGHTGYTLTVSSTGAVFVRACESEHSSEIGVSR